MQLQTHAWEHTLLSLAHEARSTSTVPVNHYFDSQLLNEAYTYCEALTAVHSRSFYLASGLLSSDQRRAVRALYAFCRVSDDTVDAMEGALETHGAPTGDLAAGINDLSVAERSAALDAWRRRALSVHPPADDLVAVAWSDARLNYHIPVRYAEQLLDGVATDLHKHRYATFDELAAYSYGVASTVGLMSMHIIGYSGPEAIPYAIKLGVALQLTNILRDVAEDWRRNRVYLPQDELAGYGLSNRDIAAGIVTPAWRRFMQFQIERTRALYAEALPGISLLDPGGRFAIAAAADLYAAILTDIENHDYDVFTRRASIGKWGKLRRLPEIWWKSRTLKIQ